MRILVASPLAAFALVAACGGGPHSGGIHPVHVGARVLRGSGCLLSAGTFHRGGAGAAPAPTQVTIESQREGFMTVCVAKVPAPDYCECAWDQFREAFKGTDLTRAPAHDDPRMVSFQQKTLATCGTKLPEEAVKTTFIKSCAGDEPRKAPYCQCAWPALRKTLAVTDFLGDFEGPRFDAAKKTMVVACKGKFPVDLAKADFMEDCTKGAPTGAKRCECAWTKLTAKYSAEAIVAGTLDMDTVPTLTKDCK